MRTSWRPDPRRPFCGGTFSASASASAFDGGSRYGSGYYKNAKGAQHGDKGSSLQRKLKDRELQTFVIGLTLLSTTCLLMSMRSQLKVQPLRLASDQCEPVTQERLDGMVYICNGAGCDYSFLCHSINLLRFESNWQGPIYVISDRQDFISEAACENNRAKYEVIVAPETPTMMHMKNFKRQLFDLVPNNATRLIYIDADILPVGCLHDFLANENPKDIGMFLDSWCKGCNKFLGGFVYMTNTEATRRCLQEWIDESSSDDFKRYKKDQDAMDSILAKGSVCNEAIHTLSSSYIETFDDNMILPLFGVIRGKAPTFQHFSHGIRGLPIWPRIKRNIEGQIEHVYNIEDDDESGESKQQQQRFVNK
mmetsp:Transcript_13047/g.36599  ORF Transcript_13047/g.36599 Transcript_13047/m.36599 type:complete len:365 (+) Transcript_13047:1688-2782(+)